MCRLTFPIMLIAFMFLVLSGCNTIGAGNSALDLEAIPQGQISLGEEVIRSLDTIFEAHDWKFQGYAGQEVTIRCETTSGHLTDPRINLLDPKGKWLTADDDSGGAHDALIANYHLPENGVYTIKIDVFDTGEYALSVN